MGVSVYDYQSSEASSSTTGGWNTAENQDPSTVNDGMRAHKQNVANYLKDQGGINTTGGSANAHTVTLSEPIATTVPTGFVFTVKLGFTNTSTTVNLNVNSIGNARVKVNYGGLLADPLPGDMQAGAYATFLYNGTQHVLLNPQQQARYSPGHIQGLALTNDAGDATNDIGIAVGSARDSTDAANIDLATALIKQLDVAWAVGTNAGMLATGVAVTNTTYYLFLIKRADTGVVDFAADTSSTGANIAANTNAAYTIKRLVSVVVRSGGVNGVPFLLPASATASTYGQLVFPAVQNPSSNPNTLDDYEEGTATITASFVTPGTSSWAYTLQAIRYTKIGDSVGVSYDFDGTPTIGTGSSNLNLGGFPFTPVVSTPLTLSSLNSSWAWPSSRTQMAAVLSTSPAAVVMQGLGTAASSANLTASNMTTGASHVIRCAGTVKVS